MHGSRPSHVGPHLDTGSYPPGLADITRDRHIQDRPAEIEAVRASAARMINLVADDAIGTFAQFEVLLCQWRRIEALLEEGGPFIYSVTRTSFRRIEL